MQQLQNAADFLSNLPTELIRGISLELTPKQLFVFSKTNHRIQAIAKDLWKDINNYDNWLKLRDKKSLSS